MRIQDIAKLFLFCLLLAGCSQGDALEVVSETDEPTYRRAEQRVREGRYDEALTDYLKVVRKRIGDHRDAPESHFAVGQIYLQHVKDPIAAIYHLREYLRLEPDSTRADKVEAMIVTAQKNFAANLPGQPYSESIDRMDLMDLLKQVREENLRLKRQLATAVQRLQSGEQNTVGLVTNIADSAGDPQNYTPPLQTRTAQERASTSSTPSTYTVQSGDSLYRISSRVYNTGAHWRRIFEANRDQLSSPSELRPGMVLRIPPNP